MKMLLVGAKGYSFTQENGKEVEGAKITLLPSTPTMMDDLQKGYLPIQETVTLDLMKTLYVPGIYEVDYAMTSGRGNKATMKLSQLKFVREVDLSTLFLMEKAK